MSELCSLHSRTGVGQSGEYLKPDVDRQVGLGMLGLANFLAKHKVTYKQFGDSLERVLNREEDFVHVGDGLAFYLMLAIEAAADVARENNMERAFAIAPTATCSYRYSDTDGYTTTPEIAPPIARDVDRDSGTFGVQSYNYGPVEIASEVGWDDYLRVVNGIVKLLDKTGLFHGYSFNSWSDVVTYDQQFVEDWLASPQTSLYYSLQVMGDVQDKSNAYAALGESEVNSYLEDILNSPAPDCNCGE